MKNFEDSFLRPTLTFLLKTLYRVEVRGLEHYRAAGDKVVIASNHQSFLDPLLLSVFIPEKPTFAMNKWYFRWVDLIVNTYKIDPLAPMSMKRLMTDLKKSGKLVIFPEGRITTTGGIMKIYDGTGRIIEKTGATLLPVHIDGAQYSKLGKLGKKLRTRFFPKITINFLPPKQYAEGEEISALKIYDAMTNAAFAFCNSGST
jgi:acyl-[acyl-carrier-protein]-phospholipid O-acyltransferase / long-chain-fatty-acid--[acyl-carrier-protein] ligase